MMKRPKGSSLNGSLDPSVLGSSSLVEHVKNMRGVKGQKVAEATSRWAEKKQKRMRMRRRRSCLGQMRGLVM